MEDEFTSFESNIANADWVDQRRNVGSRGAMMTLNFRHSPEHEEISQVEAVRITHSLLVDEVLR